MTNCKINLKMQYGNNLQCRICHHPNSQEDEDHILIYRTINNEKFDIKFCDVYKDIDKQYNAVQIFKKVLRRRQV